MTTVNSVCGGADDCSIGNSKLMPDCFKLRIGFDPTDSNYDLALCTLNVVFTNSCCINTVGDGAVNNIILRIPLTFSHECFVYRFNLLTSTGTLNNVAVLVGTTITPLNYSITDGYLNIVIPVEAITSTQNSEGQCTSTIMFDSFSIPLGRTSNFCNCCPLCSSIEWVEGTTQISSGGGGGTVTGTTTTRGG